MFNFPKEMFLNKEVLDFGGGTGEDSVIFSRWGANVTLVEMNNLALDIAKKVFKKYGKNYTKHKFICKSLFDYKSSKKFDICHARGVFSHTYNKQKAFNLLCRYLKPGGFVIFGDPNLLGGFQNMLQRIIVYKFGKKNQNKMVQICEELFSEDITRSQMSISNRSRKAIIFDRWIIQQQDDPSVSEVFNYFINNNIKFYSSYPKLNSFFSSDSFNHLDKLDITKIKEFASLTETHWMIKNKDDAFNIKNYMTKYSDFFAIQNKISKLFQNVSPLKKEVNLKKSINLFKHYEKQVSKTLKLNFIEKELLLFIQEVKIVLKLINKNDFIMLKIFLKNTKILFKGFVGVRHVDFIGYKHKYKN
jgi:SAM-dependent methyltransferase